MEMNKVDDLAQTLTYAQFAEKFTWIAKDKKWQRRQRGEPIGRIHHCSPRHGHLFYLRILLNHVMGPTSYEDIKTVNGKKCQTFQEACYELGLLEDDNEYIQCIQEASESASGHFLRTMFVMLLMSGSLTQPAAVWNTTWKLLSEDILYRERRIHRRPDLELEDDELKCLTLNEIEELLKRNGSSLTNFNNMPHPDNTEIHFEGNRLVDDETTTYNVGLLRTEHEQLYSSLTDEQQTVYHTVMDAINRGKGGVFFLNGYGGTGKTFVWKTLAAAIRSKREIVLNVASSGIAALLLEGGGTTHSRFAIPINITETSFCCIRPDSDLAGLIRQTKLIIWDEAPMVHKHSFEALDRTFRDILRSSNPNSMNEPFGGKVVVFGGDFRRVLPVLPNASRQDVFMASLKSSYLWHHCKLLKLTKNMRLTVGASTDLEEIRQFAEWILDIGNGTVNEPNDGEATIELPDDILIKDEGRKPIDSIVDSVYPDISSNMSDPSFFQDKAILAPTHEVVDMINEHVMSKIAGKDKVYLSADSICEDEGSNFNEELYTQDFLNSIKVSGIPHHRLVLKVGVPVMLLRNIDQPSGLCNGTRLKI
uniref:uncharacterized protein LOC122609384 n=1 Tax=Erigeron canadensis TaxID=72917 RepID=UPI001CB9BC7C|nr:uncharacterized protein LOC122609384 [Erigeron canadensis]